MRTNIDLDDRLVRAAMRKAGVSTKKAAVDAALRAYVRPAPDYAGLLALDGSGAVESGYDPKGAQADPWSPGGPDRGAGAGRAGGRRGPRR